MLFHPPQAFVCDAFLLTSESYLSVGDDQGHLHVLSLPKNLVKPVLKEKSIMEKFFARELSKTANYTARKVQLEAVKTKIEKRHSIQEVDLVEVKDSTLKPSESFEFSSAEVASMNADYAELLSRFTTTRGGR
jgi:hypothetical protein